MVFGNPYCSASSQNCPGNCCNSAGYCPNIANPTCYYYYYNYGTQALSSSVNTIAVAVGVSMGALVVIAIGVICYVFWRRRTAAAVAAAGLGIGMGATVIATSPSPMMFPMGMGGDPSMGMGLGYPKYPMDSPLPQMRQQMTNETTNGVLREHIMNQFSHQPPMGNCNVGYNDLVPNKFDPWGNSQQPEGPSDQNHRYDPLNPQLQENNFMAKNF